MWGAIIAGVGALFSSMSSGRAASKTERTAQINANLVKDESAEEMRRLLGGVQKSESMTAAMSATSGVTMSGSRELAVQGFKKENQAQLNWLLRTGRQKYNVVKRGGQLQASQLRSKATSQAFTGFGQIAQGIYSNYNTGN